MTDTPSSPQIRVAAEPGRPVVDPAAWRAINPPILNPPVEGD